MRFWLTFLVFLVFASASFAQKFGYVDTEFITSKMPDYAKVQQQIEQNTKTWLSDVEKKKQELVRTNTYESTISPESEYKLKKITNNNPKMLSLLKERRGPVK